jgi:hypothetical protein
MLTCAEKKWILKNIVGARSRDRSGTPQWRGFFVWRDEEYSVEPGRDVSSGAARNINFCIGWEH